MNFSWYAASLIGLTVLTFAMLSAIAFIQIWCVVSADDAMSNVGNMELIRGPASVESCRMRNLLFISCVASWYFRPVSIIWIVSLSTETLLPLMFARVGGDAGRDLRLAGIAAGDGGAEAVLEAHGLRGVARRLGVREVRGLDALARRETVQ